MRITSLLPDFNLVLQFRGWLVKPCFKSCGRNFQIASGATIVYTSRVTIGNDVNIACGAWIHGMGNVTIEDEVMLGPYCVLVTGSHTKKEGSCSFRFGDGAVAPIYVGKGAWLCSHVVVTSGIEIGTGAVCSAGAVLIKNVPSNTVVAGNPARVVMTMKGCQSTSC